MIPVELSQERILVACLDWGSGHVSRSISLLKQLSKQGNELFISCTTNQKSIFEGYEIRATYLKNDGFQFRFKGDGNFTSEMRRNVWHFFRWIKQEQRQTEKLVGKYQISLVLSDHCYGFRSKKVLSIFITHQVSLPPKAGWIAQQVHRKWMNRFNEIWIMDDAQQRLAGALSNSVPKSTYIGFYSRFQDQETSVISNKIVGIISGPEPYSKQFFQWIVEKYRTENLTLISPKLYSEVPNNITVICDWKLGDAEIASAETIISRNGYSTLMDLQFLKKKAVLIPTPGQLEQEYLASFFRSK
ncbi:glycosyltransferase [Fluviicola taffensis]|uniref:Glycosyltransferase 28 domain protein n=1 Tax=Fluviicola taffensis (strain DSM 16823 / NCIMB 13979 / RW262) TaxID=755732 RepID=F2IBI3_FLUTR|nr:glycosyltransferase [Fluviicola taffensis]AEA44291.1 glycosyltransferase 28 domain protein [Fluviicola taffensis DSM 16823]